MATLAGFEPRVFALRMQRPEPLDEKVKKPHYSDKNKILDKIPAVAPRNGTSLGIVKFRAAANCGGTV